MFPFPCQGTGDGGDHHDELQRGGSAGDGPGGGESALGQGRYGTVGLSGCRIRRLMSRQRGRRPPDAIPDALRVALMRAWELRLQRLLCHPPVHHDTRPVSPCPCACTTPESRQKILPSRSRPFPDHPWKYTIRPASAPSSQPWVANPKGLFLFCFDRALFESTANFDCDSSIVGQCGTEFTHGHLKFAVANQYAPPLLGEPGAQLFGHIH